MSSSRDSPFSFSPDLVDIFGSPDSLNGAVRLAHPQLFDGSVERHLQLFANEHGGRGVCVRPGAELPANSVVGLFSGRLTCGRECRGDRLLSLPSLRVNHASLQLCVDAAAHSARFPSPLQAALYQHSCAGGSVVGEWQAADPIPTFQYLVARTSHALLPGEDLHWNFDEHALDGLYTLSQADVLLRRRSGGLARRCPCEAPRTCPLDRFVRVAPTTDSSPPHRPSRPAPALRPLALDDDSDFEPSPPRRRPRRAAPAPALPPRMARPALP